MKRNTFLHTATLTVLAFLALAVCQAWAATPLEQPVGLALDANGNLYVANWGLNGNDGAVTIYNSKYVQKSAITAGIARPTGVALDSQGNLYVANYLNSSIYKYVGGVQDAGATITANVLTPTGIAIDSMDDVWVDNNAGYITMYSPFGTLLDTVTPGSTIDSIATQGEWFVLGLDSTWLQIPTGEVLTNQGNAGEQAYPSHNQAVAAAFNASGDYFMAQATGEVDLLNPYTSGRTFVLQVTYAPSAIVVDSKRGRIYLANRYGSTIDVYSNKGVYITTIQ